jgi:hypothetical protein
MGRISSKNVVIVILILAYLTYAFRDLSLRSNLKTRKKQVMAEIVDSYGAYRGGLSVKYRYSTNFGNFTGGTVINEINGYYCNLFKSKFYPLVYDSVNPSYSQILILPEKFAEYGIKFPDSLEWVNKYRK